jgi:energy-coupling factor transport system permease protein
MMALIPSYRYRPSPLHAARAGAATAFCVVPCAVALAFESPVVLAAALGGIVAAAAAAGVGGELRRAAWLGVPLALLVVAVNALVSREGDTVLVRGGEILGWRLDITLEAIVYGGVAALRVLVLVMALALFTAVVDPDDTLRLFRRVSYRSALTASLATRLVPVLARDAARMSDAARCRPVPAPRAGAARAALRGALDRAVDVAAALELRGYAGAVRPARTRPRWSRHDLRVAAAAAIIVGAAVLAAVEGVGGFEAYPTIDVALGPGEAALAATLLCVPLLPFAGGSARLGVARA